MASETIDLGLVASMHVTADKRAKLDIIDIIQGLANNDREPQLAATQISEVITAELKADEARCLDPAIPTEFDDGGYVKGPRPENWESFVYTCLSDAAKVGPADHPHQARLVQLVLELQELPKVPFPGISANGEYFYFKELWTLDRANHNEPFEEILAFWNPGEYSMEGTPDKHIPYINYSAFMARLMGSGAMNSAALSALIRSSFRKSPTDQKMDVKEYQACVVAAAQWIFYAGAAIYEICQAGALLDVSSYHWSQRAWISFKDKFGKISSVDRFGSNVQEVAAKAVDAMVGIEKQGVTTNFIELYGFLVPLPLEDTDEEDGKDEDQYDSDEDKYQTDEGDDEDYDNDDNAKEHNGADDNSKIK